MRSFSQPFKIVTFVNLTVMLNLVASPLYKVIYFFITICNNSYQWRKSRTCKSYIGMLDTVHNQCIRICLGAFRTLPMQSLYVEAHEPPLHIRRIKLALQFSVKLMPNVKNLAFPMVFQADYSAK